MNSTAFLDALRGLVGPGHVHAEGDLGRFEQDWRQRVRGKALAVVLPATTEEVAAVVKLCAAHQQDLGVSIVPQGGNTGLVAPQRPVAEQTEQQRIGRHRRRSASAAPGPPCTPA